MTGDSRTPAERGYRMPAEWATHHATWFAWPHNESDWPNRFSSVPPVFAELIRILAHVERVRIIVRNEAERARVESRLEENGTPIEHVDFFVAQTNRSWTRDYVPSFVTGASGLAAVKWRFNGWARYEDFEDDEAAGMRVSELIEVPRWTPAVADNRVILEGGALDVDGEGTILVCEECLLTGPFARNPALDREAMEGVLRDYLGVTRVLWLTTGVAGDDTSGHVDDFARFVAPGKVVLCREDDDTDENYRSLRENRERLQGAKDAEGRSIEVIDLPMPSPLVVDGQRLPASYANFYVANDMVLVPTFDDDHDVHAVGLLGELFPGRRAIGVRCVDLVLGLGSIHCSTQQEPKP